MTEKEAKGKWCFQARMIVLNRTADDKKGATPIGSNMPGWKGQNCVGRACMAWCSTTVAGEEESGYCGLVAIGPNTLRSGSTTH